MTKYRSIGVLRIGAGYQFRFQGEKADWNYWPEGREPEFNSLAAPDDLVQKQVGGKWVNASHWARDPGELAAEALLQARADGKAYRERGEARQREEALAEAQRLREEAKASEAAAKEAEKRATELEVANTA